MGGQGFSRLETIKRQTSGDLAWRFAALPGKPEEDFENEATKTAATTWTGECWKRGGGGGAETPGK